MPSCVTIDPAVPFSVDVMKGASSCQHCNTDTPFSAAVVVRLRCVIAKRAIHGSRSKAKNCAGEVIGNHGLFVERDSRSTDTLVYGKDSMNVLGSLNLLFGDSGVSIKRTEPLITKPALECLHCSIIK